MTMVVCFTLSSAKDLPSSMAEINLHVPCSPSKSFLVAESSGFMTTFYKTGLPLAHELFQRRRNKSPAVDSRGFSAELLWESREPLAAGRHRHPRRIHHHGKRREVTGDSDDVEHALFAKALYRAGVGGVRDAFVAL